MIDVNAWIGGFPYRHVPHPEPAVLARVVAREGLSGAWVGHLPSAFWRDPSPGNTELYAALAPYPTLHPAPCIRPDWPGVERQVAAAVAAGAPAVRVYPMQWGLAPGDGSLGRLGAACAEAGLVVVFTVRFEDVRQRHPLDVSSDLTAAHVRAFIRAENAPPTVLTHAGRDLIEEIFWSLTERERARLWFDFCCVWGPPEDHLSAMFRTLGPARFVYGTGWPLRLTQAPRSSLDLLPDDLRAAAITDAAAFARPRSGPPENRTGD